jgi:hypothetical protein
MSTYMRKCIDIAPTAVINPERNPANDYTKLVQQPWWPPLRATTTHARFWADWPSLQPVAGTPPNAALLDAQVDAALADGMKIIMVPYRYPMWTNGTEGIVVGSETDNSFFPWDRVVRLAQYMEWRAGLRLRPGFKAFQYRMPLDGFGPDSQWGRYVAWLWDRYADRLEAFEVVNEPNGQLWPQRSQVETEDFDTRWSDGAAIVTAPAVAEMMLTVDGLARDHAKPPLLLAPSCSDSLTVAPRTTTLTLDFAAALLDALEARGFRADERWIWAYHNYVDVEQRRQQVVALRALLAERGWAGRRLDGGPELWATEGGCRLAAMTTRFGLPATAPGDAARREHQALVLREALARHHYAKGAGAGVGMFTQYTTYADPGFDDGLLEPFAGIAVPRPSLGVWCETPEFHAAPAQRAAWRPQL